MKILCLVAAWLLSINSALAQNWTTVTASNIQDLGGNPLASGSLCFQAMNDNGVYVSVQAGGGGQTLSRPVCAGVYNGALVGSFQVPNPANTLPQYVKYEITVKNGSQTYIDYKEVAFTGSPFDFDAYSPGAFNPISGYTVSGNLGVNGNLSVTGTVTGGSFSNNSWSGTQTFTGTVDVTGGEINISNGNGAGASTAALFLSGTPSDLGISFDNTGTSGNHWQLLSSSSGSGLPAGNFSLYDRTNNEAAIEVAPSTEAVTIKSILFVDGGSNIVYRCATSGTLPAGALTITSGSCGSTTDTGLRVD